MPSTAPHPPHDQRPPGIPGRESRPLIATTGDRVGDAELMRSLQDGDPAAFEAIYDRHARAVYALAHRILRECSAAEDVTEEAFLTVWRSRHHYAPERGVLRSWLLSIARNRAIDVIRRQRGHFQQPLERDHDQQEARERTDTQVLQRVEAATITKALQSLPLTQRRVVELAYFGGLTLTEIAAELRLPLGPVKGQIRLALIKLARQLEPDRHNAGERAVQERMT